MEWEWEQDMSWRITVANCVSAKVMRFLLQLLEAPAHGPGGKVRAARLLTQAHLAGRGCAAGAWLLRRWLVSSQPIPLWSTLQTPPLSPTPALQEGVVGQAALLCRLLVEVGTTVRRDLSKPHKAAMCKVALRLPLASDPESQVCA